MQTLFERSFYLADLLLGASQTPTYIHMIEADHTGYGVESQLSKWAGGIGDDNSPAMYAAWKAYTLLAKGSRQGISRTPIPNFDDGCEWKGGLREDHYIVAASAWENDNVDLMLAALLMWSISYEVRFHHVGFKHQSEQDCQEEIGKTLDRYDSVAISKSAPDHQRWYIPVQTRQSPNGIFWVEHQLWPNDWVPGIHWDFATSDPEDMIRFISEITGIQGEYWRRVKDAPCCMISIHDQYTGKDIAIHARPKWTHIDSWED